MKRSTGTIATLMIGGLCATTVHASEAATQASARGGRGRSGSAAATAQYTGDAGLARTQTRTGRINIARGLAVGVDENGLSLSFSHALAGKRGPAYSGTFNLSIGRDGQVAGSYGGAVSRGQRDARATRPG